MLLGYLWTIFKRNLSLGDDACSEPSCLLSRKQSDRFSFVTHTERWLTAQELGFVSNSPGICRNCGSAREGWSWRHVVLLNISSMNEIFCLNKNETRQKSVEAAMRGLGKASFLSQEKRG